MAKNNWNNYTQSEIVHLGNYGVFVSYYTPIAILGDGYVWVVDQKFSRTTSKQTTRFLREYAYGFDVVYASPNDFRELLKKIDWTRSTGWIR